MRQAMEGVSPPTPSARLLGASLPLGPAASTAREIPSALLPRRLAGHRPGEAAQLSGEGPPWSGHTAHPGKLRRSLRKHRDLLHRGRSLARKSGAKREAEDEFGNKVGSQEGR